MTDRRAEHGDDGTSDITHEDEGALASAVRILSERHRDSQRPASHLPLEAPSRVIAGKYKLGRIIGEGGMGSVYEAEHKELGIHCAIKLLSESYADDEVFLGRFRREARAAAAVRHPNVVSVTDAGTDDDGVPFIVMELLDGESLGSVLRHERILEPDVAASIVYQVLEGLKAAHAKEVVHRDLKPANVFIAIQRDGSQVAKLLDFGISKFHGESQSLNVTADGAVIGTPSYMAPEQVRGEGQLDARTDIYAAGVLLYRMVTGRLPFVGKEPREIYDKILHGVAVEPHRLRDNIPPELEHVILKAIRPEKNRRFQSADEFLAALKAAVPGLSTIEPLPVLSRHNTDHEVDVVAGGGTRAHSHRAPASSAPTVTPPTFSPRRRTQALVWGWAAVLLLLGAWVWAVGHGEVDTTRAAMSNAPTIFYGITRYSSKQMVVEEHQPVVDYLSSSLENKAELVIVEDYQISDMLAAGKLQVAVLSGYRYVLAKTQLPDLRLVATGVNPGGPTYEGHILTRSDSGIKSLGDLKGKVFCYVSPNSSSGYLYPRALFRREGMDPDGSFRATRFTGDHSSALGALNSGACDGAAVAQGFTLKGQPTTTAQRFRVLASTDRIPYDAYCISGTVPNPLASRISQALLALVPDSEHTQRVLGEQNALRGFVAATDESYNGVREVIHMLDEPMLKQLPEGGAAGGPMPQPRSLTR